MKNSFKILIVVLLVIVIALLAFNLYLNKNILKEYKEFNTSNKPVDDTKGNKTNTNNNEYVGKSNDDLREFQLEIEYANDEIELDYEAKGDLVEAKYKNEITGEKLYGEDAEKVFNILSDIDFSGPQSQVVDLILSGLNLKEDFSKFELEVDYLDNSKVEFEIKN